MLANSCCCYSFHVACLIIGNLGVIGSIVSVGLGSAVMHENMYARFEWLMGLVFVVVGTINLLVNVMLIAGTSMAKRGFLVPYMILGTLSIPMSTVVAIMMENYASLVGIGLAIYPMVVVNARHTELGDAAEAAALAEKEAAKVNEQQNTRHSEEGGKASLPLHAV